MKTSPAGLALIAEFEGCKLKAYQDGGGVWTIGIGHTGPEVKEGLEWTEQQADAMLERDVLIAERCVNDCVTTPLVQGEYDALVSFVFNLGCGALRRSTLLRKLLDHDYDGASEEFLKWDHDNGVKVAGLTRRRKAEQALFESV